VDAVSASKLWIDNAAPILAREVGEALTRRTLRMLAALPQTNATTKNALDALAAALPGGADGPVVEPAEGRTTTPPAGGRPAAIQSLADAADAVREAQGRLYDLGLPSVAVTLERMGHELTSYQRGLAETEE
jgi:hypothetical protein